MKRNIISEGAFIVLLLVFFASCKKLDNYASPSASLYGAIIDKGTGDTIQTGIYTSTYNGYLNLYQLNYGSSNPNPIKSSFSLNGTYENDQLFSGSYKVVPSGAFFYVDTLTPSISGKTHLDIKVIEWIHVTAQITAITANSITVSYTIDSNAAAQAIVPQMISRVGAVIGNTAAVDRAIYLQRDYRAVFGTPNAQITGTYTYTFTSLTPNTTYYVRGMARTSDGTDNPPADNGININDLFNYSGVLKATTTQ